MDDRWLPGQTKTFGRAAIGHDRPNPLFRSDHVMDNAPQSKKAEKTGVYVVKEGTGTETHMRFKEGDILPDGATFRDAGSEREPSLREQERARIAGATDERALSAAPENRAAKGTAKDAK